MTSDVEMTHTETDHSDLEELQDCNTFPVHRLKSKVTDGKTPLCLVACGSFSPITFLHLRMFEMAYDSIRTDTSSPYEVVGGYFSPVSDAYKKVGLASARHRVQMCQIAAEVASPWLMVDPWEAMQATYQPTALVLDHFDNELNSKVTVTNENGEQVRIKIALLAGADLIQTMSTPGVWSQTDLNHILGGYETYIVERSGTDIEQALQALKPWEENIHTIPQLIKNDISSTKIRLFLKRDMSIRYLIPSPVIDYIKEHSLYQEDVPEKKDEGKGKGKQTDGDGEGIMANS